MPSFAAQSHWDPQAFTESLWLCPQVVGFDLIYSESTKGRAATVLRWISNRHRGDKHCVRRQQWAGVHVGLTAEFKCNSLHASSSRVHAHVPRVWFCVGSWSLIKKKRKKKPIAFTWWLSISLWQLHSGPCLGNYGSLCFDGSCETGKQ